MGKVIMSGIVPPLVAPVGEIIASNIAVGSIVKLNESGNPVEFYVAKHDYESALNGAGRTLLVRKDCYDTRVWHSSTVNAYASSSIDSWLNNTYKSLLDSNVQTIISTTKFYYTPGNGNTSVSNLDRSIFLLSVSELGQTTSSSNTEGSSLPISSKLLIAYLGGSVSTQWTRSPTITAKTAAKGISTGGTVGSNPCTHVIGSRPCFTIPSNAKFDMNTMVFKGV